MTREHWWSAVAEYPGRKPFHLGSVRATGSEHARQELVALWQRISPHPAPETITPMRGRLVMVDDE